MLSSADWNAIWLSIELAGLTTLILIIIALPLAWWLAFHQSRLKAIIAALVALPLILPPSVIGFYLLVAMGPHGLIGKLCQTLGIELFPFTFNGLLIASIIYSLPFVVQPIQNTFSSIGKKPLEIAATLGAKPLDAWLNVVLPLAKNGILSAAVLGFAHTIGEFGIVLMIGGNIPHKTQLISLQIYNHVEEFEYAKAGQLSLILLIFSFAVLSCMYWLNQKFNYLNKA